MIRRAIECKAMRGPSCLASAGAFLLACASDPAPPAQSVAPPARDASTAAPPPPAAAGNPGASVPSMPPPPLVSAAPPPSGTSPGASAAPAVATAKCGRLPSESIVATKWGFSPNLGGGNDCDAIATVWANVAHTDRTCGTDADCVAVSGNGHCFDASLNRRAAKQTRYAKTPCGNPMAGPCLNRNLTPRCNGGCCEMSP